jgi:hypothetical protein
MNEERAPEGHDDVGVDPLAATIALFDETADVVRHLLERVKAGELGRIEELGREQAGLRRALAAAVLERQHARKIKQEDEHVAEGHLLDLGAARAEIGRRLARLRAAEDIGGGAEAAEPER